jgi:hypothetical protein
LHFATVKDHPRRAICFLVSKDNKIIAKSVFDALNTKSERKLRAIFDNWRDGQFNKKWYHGWTRSEFNGRYTDCFVFKLRENRLNHRFYGFLCNPNPINQRFQLCVLVTHTFKDRNETYEADLKRVNLVKNMTQNLGVIKNSYRR